jgi:ParB family chromosome partitioning protein
MTHESQQAERYWLIAGERRWRAARLAALASVPAIVREASPQQLLELALVENLQRADLNPLEEATAYQTLTHEFSLTQAEIGQRVGKSRSAVANTLRLLQLPLPAQQALTEQRISAGHARALLALSDQAAMNAALEQILTRDLSVRQTEEMVRQLLLAPQLHKTQPEPPTQPWVSQVAYLENRFRTALGTRVNLNRNADGSGRLIIHFYNDEDLDNLVRVITPGDELGDTV